ncbi:MAG: MFS transporter [Candidatus Bathyarchaeota archaeon]|nr:MFS transporter [Candidatus Bathyarchaeota archaeon]MDH5686634.1 MFS transporter [Candidatus Bathyarchaeota archaeon]
MGLKSYPKEYFELMLVGFTLIMGMSLSSAFLPIFAHELDPSGLLVGFVISAWSFSRVFTELPSGILADRFGRRRLLVGGLALSALGAFLCSMAYSVYLLIVGRTFWGLGTALFFMSSTALLFDLFKSNVRGRALGTFQGIEFTGSLIGAPMGSFLVAILDYRGVFSLAFISILCSFLIAFFSKGLRQTDAEESKRSEISLSELLPSLRSWSLAAVCIYSFSRMLIMSGLNDTVFPLYLNLELGIGIELIGLIISLRTAGAIIATVTSGFLSDRFGRKPMIVLGLIMQSSCYYAYTILSSFEMFLLFGLFEGFSRGMSMTSAMVLLSEIVPSRLRAGGIGIYRTFMDIGGFFGPLFFITLFDRSATTPFLSALVILALNTVLLSTIKSKRAVSPV